jgi:His/Glu/Gln/Arg/opine family amino acid ABC transporter permease subunit
MAGGLAYYFDWNVIWRNSDRYIDGAGVGLALTAGCVGAGIVIGIAAALASTSQSRILRIVVNSYVELIRNIPILLLTYFAYYGLPQLGVRFLDNVESFVLVLSLYAGAFFSEVFRSGIQAVPAGYLDAGKALGLTYRQRVQYILLPVVLRIVLPSLSNGVISVFKDTSVGFAIAIPELTGAAMWVNVNTFHVIESWLTAGLIYLGLSYLIAVGMRALERRLSVER